MSNYYEEIKCLDQIFRFPQTKILDSQFNALRADMPALYRAALREYYCHQKSVEQISTDLETSTQEVQKYIALGFLRLKQYHRRLLVSMGNVFMFGGSISNSPCHRCHTQLNGRTPEKYCPNCFWDEVADPTKDRTALNPIDNKEFNNV